MKSSSVIADFEPKVIDRLSVVALIPHSGCNCRCVMCDIWKANRDRRELSESDLARHVESIAMLRPTLVTLTGGEALMSPNIWSLCRMLRDIGVSISLMSTGLLLRRHAKNVATWCDAVTVSLDGTETLHNAVRRVPRAFEQLEDGVAALKALRPRLPIVGRCVVQRTNFRELAYIIHTAKGLDLDTLSFLPADTGSEGFNRPIPWGEERVSEIALDAAETEELAEIIEEIITRYPHEIDSGFIHERADGLRNIARYYAAVNHRARFPEVRCNAPWVSAVIEADESVRPCYFHPPIGSVRDRTLLEVLNSPEAMDFRAQLDIATNPICQRCVCALYIPDGTGEAMPSGG